MSDFSRTVNKFAKRFGIDALTIVQKTAFDLHAGFIDGNPRDTGRAASSWNLTKDNIDLTVSPKGLDDYEGVKPIIKADLSSVDFGKKSVTFYISNNLSYIVPLSRGHSKQAPDGWIERVVANYENFLKRRAR